MGQNAGVVRAGLVFSLLFILFYFLFLFLGVFVCVCVCVTTLNQRECFVLSGSIHMFKVGSTKQVTAL